MAVIPLLLLEFLIFIIYYGIRLEFRLDANNMSICLKCFILDYIEVSCVKLFICEGKFYYQINKKQIKTIELDANNDGKSNRKKKKLDKSAFLSKLWGKRPSIKINELSVNYGAHINDAMNRAVLDGALMLASNTLLVTNSDKLKIIDFQLNNVTDESKFNGVDVNCVMGFSLIKIAIYTIYASLIKRKYKVKI